MSKKFLIPSRAALLVSSTVHATVAVFLDRCAIVSLKVALEEIGFAKCYHMIELLMNPEQVSYWETASEGKPVPSLLALRAKDLQIFFLSEVPHLPGRRQSSTAPLSRLDQSS